MMIIPAFQGQKLESRETSVPKFAQSQELPQGCQVRLGRLCSAQDCWLKDKWGLKCKPRPLHHTVQLGPGLSAWRQGSFPVCKEQISKPVVALS